MISRSSLKLLLAIGLSLSVACALRAQSAAESGVISEQSLKSAIADAEHSAPAQLPAALTNLARFYRNSGREAEAETLYKRVVELTRTTAKEDSRLLANSLNNLAVLYHDQGQFAKAEPLYREALRIQQASADSSRIAGTLVNLAQLYQDAGDDRNAAPVLAQLKSLWEAKHAVSDRQAAEILCELADIRERAGSSAEADSLHVRAVQLWEADPPTDRKAPPLLLQLAEVYRGKGDDANAERCYRLIVANWQSSGANTQAAAAATRLGRMYLVRTDYAQAERMFRTALKLKEAIVEPDSLELAANISSVAIVLNLQGKYGEAVPFYRRALEIRETHLGAQHPDVIQSLLFYASCLRNKGDYQEAVKVEARAAGHVVRKAL